MRSSFVLMIFLLLTCEVSASTAHAKTRPNCFQKTPIEDLVQKQDEKPKPRRKWFQRAIKKKSEPQSREEEEKKSPTRKGWFQRSPPTKKPNEGESSPTVGSKPAATPTETETTKEAINGDDLPKSNEPEKDAEAPQNKTEPTQKKDAPPNERQRIGFFSRKKQQTESSPDTNTTAATVEKETESSSNVTAEDDDSSTVISVHQNANHTTTPTTRPQTMFFSAPPPFAMQRPPPQSPVVIMGMDGRPQRVPAHRGGGTAYIVGEAIAQIIGTAIRFWFLTSVTRWFADEEIKSLKKPEQHFLWERLNDVYNKDSDALQTALRAPPMNVAERKWRRHTVKLQRKERRLMKMEKVSKPQKPSLDDMFNRTVIVVELSKFEGPTDLDHLEQVVTFVISEHRLGAFGKDPEIVFLVESPGGGVSIFGLAAAQIQRLSNTTGITTTACVDKVAASGGYMIASQCHSVVAAPFAAVGSIGVIREGLNFHKALEKYGVNPIVMTAGDAKAPLTTYGEVTKHGLEITQKNLEKTHAAFRDLVVQGRPLLEDTIEQVATGDVFLGREALDLNLVDAVMTSEDYILARVAAGDRVLKLHRMPHHIKNRRLPHIHPLDFLQSGHEWLAKQDIAKLASRLVQTTTFLRFLQHVVQNRMS